MLTGGPSLFWGVGEDVLVGVIVNRCEGSVGAKQAVEDSIPCRGNSMCEVCCSIGCVTVTKS